MSKKKACPPFCNPDTCHKDHHPLIVHLVNIDDNDVRTLDKFKSVLKDSRYSVAPEQPIPDPFREYRYPVLHWASVLGKVAVIEYLIRNGYEPTVKSLEKGETALHRVVLCLHHSLQFGRQQTVIKMFKNLTELLAPALFVKDDNGNTPLHACAILFNQVSAKSLAGLYKKALEIMIEKVKDMEDKGFSKSDGLNMGNREMKTVLHILTSGPPEDCLFLIRRLLDNGADPELQDKEGKSAIDMALECQNKQIFKEMKQKNNRKQSYASETESEICGTRVMKTPKSSLTGQNIVTSTTTKDESEQDDEAQVDNWRKRKWGKAHIEVKPTLYVNETGAKVGRQSTDTSVADGPTSTTKSSCKHKRVAWKEEQCPEPCGVEERLQNDSAIEKRLDEEKEPRLEMLLKKVNQEKLILDTVEENRRQLESVCLESDSRLTALAKEREKAQKFHEQISNDIRIKMEELSDLHDKQVETEDSIKSLDAEFKKENEKRSRIMDDLENYEKIISCLSSVK